MSTDRRGTWMKTTGPRGGPGAVALLTAWSVTLAAGPIGAENLSAPPSLKTVPVPEPDNLGLFLRSEPGGLNAGGFPIPTAKARRAAIALGKALFWDMQEGSDGIQACASCHFHAGADNRTKNQLSPALLHRDAAGHLAPDHTFTFGPNFQLTSDVLPLRVLGDGGDRSSAPLRDSD